MIPTIFKRLPWLAVTAFSILVLCACAAKSTGARQTRQHQIRPSFDSYGATFLDVTYCTMDGQPQKMDVYLPPSGGPWPVLVYVHGGSWMSGDKSESRRLVNDMTAQGYAIVSLNYRLYPSIRFPRMIEDVKCAIRSLRAHARDFHLDGNRMAAIGMSAGGHLVSLLGTSDQSTGWDVGEYLEQSSRVQAVIALAPATDLTQQFLTSEQQSQLFDGFGEANLPAASPIMHITPEDPPFLLIHGQLDPLLPVQQSQSMYERLIAAGVPAQLVVVQNGDHGLTAVDGSARPTMEQIKQIMLDFLAAHL
jgi:acetyl esterase/lipase